MFDNNIQTLNYFSFYFYRYNKDLCTDADQVGQGLDLLRCESLLGLDAATRSRVLKKNYRFASCLQFTQTFYLNLYNIESLLFELI